MSRAAGGLFERPSLTEQAVAYLSGLIVDGAWPPGRAVPPEAELARTLGVSRTVVREGVRVLASRGMLVVRQGRATVVTAPEAWNLGEPLSLVVRTDRAALLEWLEVRAILEMESAALAAERHTAEDAAALAEAVARAQGIEDSGAYMEADVHFHLTIARAAHNGALSRLLRPVMQPLREQFREAAMEPRVRALTTESHQAIVAAILAHDGPAARKAMAAHLKGVTREIAVVRDGATARGAGPEEERIPLAPSSAEEAPHWASSTHLGGTARSVVGAGLAGDPAGSGALPAPTKERGRRESS
jgi:DNA-binding FadR family transcriptional regulator